MKLQLLHENIMNNINRMHLIKVCVLSKGQGLGHGKNK